MMQGDPGIGTGGGGANRAAWSLYVSTNQTDPWTKNYGYVVGDYATSTSNPDIDGQAYYIHRVGYDEENGAEYITIEHSGLYLVGFEHIWPTWVSQNDEYDTWIIADTGTPDNTDTPWYVAYDKNYSALGYAGETIRTIGPAWLDEGTNVWVALDTDGTNPVLDYATNDGIKFWGMKI